jgi:hypothetical protein
MWGVGWGCMLAQGTPLPPGGFLGRGDPPAHCDSVPPLLVLKSERARVIGKTMSYGSASDNY